MINEASPDVVWVGLSTLKQERWMAVHVGRVTAPVLIGVGAAFDFHAGRKRERGDRETRGGGDRGDKERRWRGLGHIKSWRYIGWRLMRRCRSLR